MDSKSEAIDGGATVTGRDGWFPKSVGFNWAEWVRFVRTGGVFLHLSFD